MRIAKKLAAAFLVVCLMMTCLVSVSAAEDDGRSPNGMKNGYVNGMKKGLMNGRTNGLTNGLKDGMVDGLTDGMKEGLVYASPSEPLVPPVGFYFPVGSLGLYRTVHSE